MATTNPAERWYAFHKEELRLIRLALDLANERGIAPGKAAELSGEIDWAIATKPEVLNVQN